MMTAKEYVEGKVKSYTRLAERCRREAEASDDIVVRAGYSARTDHKVTGFQTSITTKISQTGGFYNA